MAKTALNFEDFSGTIGSEGAPTMTATTAGSFTIHRGGARTASMSGPRYGVMRDQSMERRWTIATNIICTLEGKIRFRKFGTADTTHYNSWLGATRNSDSLAILVIGHISTGEIVAADSTAGQTNSGVLVTLGEWYDFVMAIRQDGALMRQYTLDMKLSTATSWTSVFNVTRDVALADRLQLLNKDNQGGSRWIGHVSTFGSASLGNISERTNAWPTTLVDPVTGLDFYMGSQTGASTNDGADTSHQLAMTTASLTDELSYGIGKNDRLTVDNSAAVWDIGASCVDCNLQGASSITLRFEGGRSNRKAHKDISGGVATWVNTSGNIWETTDSGATDLGKCVVWENDTAMTHPVGANFAAVSATLEATAGSFWTDGTKVYIHPTGNGNPNSNGKTYLRSRDRSLSGTSNYSPLVITNTSGTTNIIGWGTQYTMYVDKDSNTSMAFRGCIYDVGAGCLGTLNLSAFTGDASGKHFGGHVLAGAINVNCFDHFIERGYAYGTPGSATAYADQSNDNTTTPTTLYSRIYAASTSDDVLWTCHGVAGSSSGRVASVTFDRVTASGKAITNSDGIDSVAARATIVNIFRCNVGAVSNAAGATMNVDTSSVTGTKTLTTAVSPNNSAIVRAVSRIPIGSGFCTNPASRPNLRRMMRRRLARA